MELAQEWTDNLNRLEKSINIKMLKKNKNGISKQWGNMAHAINFLVH